MSLWTNQKGTQTAVISTEHTLAQNSNANAFQYSVDCTNMVNGDITELRVYRIVNASAIQIANCIIANVQANPLKEFKIDASQGVTNGIKVTLKQTAGTGRNYDWELLSDGGNAAANVIQWNSTNVSAPATAGIPEVNIKNINNVAAATPGATGGLFIAGTNAATTITTGLTTTFTGNLTGSIASVTGAVGSVTGAVGSVTAAVTVDGTSPLTEAYAAQGGALTLSKALYGINQLMSQQGISGTTLTVKKRDGSTTAKTYTLDSATAPTVISETT